MTASAAERAPNERSSRCALKRAGPSSCRASILQSQSGYTVVYLSLIVLIPLAGLALKAAELGLDRFLERRRSIRACWPPALSFGSGAVRRDHRQRVSSSSSHGRWCCYRFPGRAGSMGPPSSSLPPCLRPSPALALASLILPTAPCRRHSPTASFGRSRRGSRRSASPWRWSFSSPALRLAHGAGR